MTVAVRLAPLVVSGLLCVACSGAAPRRAPAPTTSTNPPVIAVSPAQVAQQLYPDVSIPCSAGHPNLTRAQPLFEVAGQPGGLSLWALVFDPSPFVAGRQVKIAWHITGTGPVRLSALNLDTGKVVKPFAGPEFHSSSSWHRPGDEWGSVWVFPSQGCWRVTASRSTGSGSIRLTVTQPPE